MSHQSLLLSHLFPSFIITSWRIMSVLMSYVGCSSHAKFGVAVFYHCHHFPPLTECNQIRNHLYIQISPSYCVVEGVTWLSRWSFFPHLKIKFLINIKLCMLSQGSVFQEINYSNFEFSHIPVKSTVTLIVPLYWHSIFS